MGGGAEEAEEAEEQVYIRFVQTPQSGMRTADMGKVREFFRVKNTFPLCPGRPSAPRTLTTDCQ